MKPEQIASIDQRIKVETDALLYIHVGTLLLKRVGSGQVPTRLAERNRFPSQKQLALQVSAISAA
jgi:hypothetical protein